jgi:nicotinate phosphoribosyltransferase
MIITSLLDTDLYKFTMQQTVLHQFPGAEVEYSFKCRNAPSIPIATFIDNIEREIDHLCTLRFTERELEYLSTIRFLKKDYIEYLRYFQLNRKNITLSIVEETGELDIKIKGNWRDTILFEVPVLAIVNEVYNENVYYNVNFVGAKQNLESKIQKLNQYPFNLIEFGTRRRFLKDWQDFVITRLKNSTDSLFGTSNVYFAMKYNLKPMGTMAHEFLQAAQQLGPRLVDSQSFALQKWADEYRGDLGIALTDVIGIDAFLKDFDLYFVKLYDGVRHDSGCPFEFGRKIIAHYEKMGIDPKSKIIVFSDGLNFDKAIELNKEFGEQIKCSFGIGTNLTNDIPEVEPLQIVIKMVECNGRPVAKISDSKGKSMCRNKEYENYLKSVFKVGENENSN